MESEYIVERVLLADDDSDHGLLFRKILTREFPSVKVDLIEDGGQVLPFLRLNPIDILFLDLHLPCKNGQECLQEIRKDPIIKDIPIVVYSNSAQLSDIQQSFLNRADFYLVKPFSTDHLKTALRMIVSMNWKKGADFQPHYFINNRFVPYTAV